MANSNGGTMSRKVIDLIMSASRGERLPEIIMVKGDSAKWCLFGANYYDGKRNLGELIAFNPSWLNTEVQVIVEADR